MTPKEKAKELVDLFTFSCRECDFEDNAKKCSLIAVDEIIKSNPCYEDSDRGGNLMYNNNSYYWQEVKQEIQIL